MRKRTASGKSTSCWRLSFWLFSIGFRIITALFHNKTTVFVLKTVVFLTFLINPLGGLGQFKSFQKRKHMLRKMAAGVHLFCEDLYGGAGS